jgi:pyruvate-ferredoxin/flavodoxin oxidoreductase
MTAKWVTLDGNEAAANVAHQLSEVIAIYPITPSSTMGELADQWSAAGQTNIWGQVPRVAEMQSEGGAAGAVHGALMAGSLTTTFTASQGLLLMIPNMYKIAGELTPFVLHVAARTLATHALSIFGDHSDVMSARQTGFAMLCSASVQEAQDMALIAHSATLKARIPFMHFFDGFRTSHEVAKIKALEEDDLRALIPDELVAAHRERALSPDRPIIRGTAANPDSFFQAREACNGFHTAVPEIVQQTMAAFEARTGRAYRLFDYVGHPEAERVVILMGSGTETAEEYVQWAVAQGEKVGMLKVRLYRPFSLSHFVAALPTTVKSIAVLDRTKEPGAPAEPLFLDIAAALREAREEGWSPFPQEPRLIGGRYGLSSKEFTPAMVKAVFDELLKPKPKRNFTVGIVDDVTHLSLPVDESFDLEPADVSRCLFFGLGSDGTVGANKNSIKIIAEETENHGQGYFVYDSKKSGAVTVSHLRFGPRPIRSPHLIRKATFVACHQPQFVDKFDLLGPAVEGATFLLNTAEEPAKAFDALPLELQEEMIRKKIRFFVIDALKVAKESGMGGRINTVMQTAFFAISGVLPKDEAIAAIKHAIEKTYGKKGDVLVRRNFEAVDASLAHLHEVALPKAPTTTRRKPPVVSELAPDFVKRVTAVMLAGEGDKLPVSAFPPDGTWPTATAKWEKRNIAVEIPEWDSAICIQCNKCALMCPHAAIRAKVFEPTELHGHPEGFKSADYKGAEFKGKKYVIQVAPEDCTGCTLCVQVCPAKDKSNPSHKAIDMVAQPPILEREKANFDFFLGLKEPDRESVKLDVKGTQLLEPLMEFSGACAGCGETPYLKLLTQLYGDRLMIANATGCSSIYGGNLPTTPYTVNAEGRGPAWANSLFEDNAEFGFGMRLSADQQQGLALGQLRLLSGGLPGTLVDGLIAGATAHGEGEIKAQRARIQELQQLLAGRTDAPSVRLRGLAEHLVRRSIWIVGGDGWAYDIGYGGLDHVLASGEDVNILVLDTEVYSNTGGQASKSTPMGAAAKFASGGKQTPKKDLALLALSYGHVYVAKVAIGAKDGQTVKAFQEAESWRGPSLILAYSPCIAHGYDLAQGAEQTKLAVESGYWPLFRNDPRRLVEGQAPLQLDSAAPKGDLGRFLRNETRFRMVEQAHPEDFARMLAESQLDLARRYATLSQLAQMDASAGPAPATKA